MELSGKQQEKQKQLLKSSIIGGVIVGAIAAAVAYWMMGDLNDGTRALAAIAAGAVVAAALSWKNYRASAKEARCKKCDTAFSISRTDRTETLAASRPKEDHEELDDGSIKTTRWLEEDYDVVETYTCAHCGDVTTREFNTSRRKNEEVRIKAPTGKKTGKAGAGAKDGKGGKSGA